MAQFAHQHLPAQKHFIDLQDHPLPLCSGNAPKPEAVLDIMEHIASAESIILAGPVYNYDLNAAAKNLIEWTGRAWSGKVVGFLLSAGGKNSYMAPLGFINSLMLDFRCIIVPRYVYADRHMFTEDGIHNSVRSRIENLALDTAKLGACLKDYQSQ